MCECTGALVGETLAGRYALLGQVGRGASGVVHKARDLQTGTIVAVKRPRLEVANAIHSIRHEFRVRQQVAHPGLVGLRALSTEGQIPFLVMEWIDGCPVDQWFEGGVRKPLSALRLMLLQVLDGLRALHEGGIVHGDLKPSHILVEPDGRAVLIDFDLAIPISRMGRDEETNKNWGGTMGFLSPERMGGGPPTPAADIYALGAIVGDLLSRSGESDASLRSLATAMTARSAKSRPTIERIRQTLDAHPASVLRDRRKRFFGRTHEMAQLLSRPRPRQWSSFLIHGSSGVGKTALAEAALEHMFKGRRGTTWLSRCLPEAAVPFRALDGWLDGIAAYRERKSTGSKAYEALTETFVRLDPKATGDRGRAGAYGRPVEAFVAMVREVARDAGSLRLWLDDAQWVDSDSLPYLEALIQARPDHVTLLVTSRSGAHGWLGDETTRIPLAGLGLEALNQWARQVGRLLSTRTITRWLDKTSGNPMLLSALFESPEAAIPEDPGQIIVARLGSLSPAAFELFSRLALCVTPLPRSGIDAMVGIESDRQVQELRHAGLIQEDSWASEPAFSPVHDLLRETIVARLTPEIERHHHRTLADVFVHLADIPPGTIAHHYGAAGVYVEGSRWARRAADSAFSTKAWSVAAGWYQKVLDWSACDDAANVRLRLAESLMAAGSAARAYEVWSQLAETKHRTVAVVRAAELAYGTGDRAAGDRWLKPELRALGMWWPHRRWAMVAALGWVLIRQWRRRQGRVRRATEVENRRLQACWAAGGALASIDSEEGFYFHAHYAATAEAFGTALDRARASALALAFQASSSKSQVDAHKTIERMKADLRDVDEPEQRAVLAWAIGYAQFITGEVESGFEFLSRASAVWEAEGRGGWERDHAERFVAWSLAFMARYGQMHSYARMLLIRAEREGNRMLVDQLKTGPLLYSALLADDVSTATEQLGVYDNPARYPQVLEFAVRRARVENALYRGDAESALREVRDFNVAMKAIASTLHRKVEHSLHEALAWDLSESSEGKRKCVDEGLRRLWPCVGRWAEAVRFTLRSWQAVNEGRVDDAVDLYKGSSQLFATIGMQGHHLACEYRQAVLLADRARYQNVVVDIMNLGVKSVHRWIRMMIPGPEASEPWPQMLKPPSSQPFSVPTSPSIDSPPRQSLS